MLIGAANSAGAVSARLTISVTAYPPLVSLDSWRSARFGASATDPSIGGDRADPMAMDTRIWMSSHSARIRWTPSVCRRRLRSTRARAISASSAPALSLRPRSGCGIMARAVSPGRPQLVAMASRYCRAIRSLFRPAGRTKSWSGSHRRSPVRSMVGSPSRVMEAVRSPSSRAPVPLPTPPRRTAAVSESRSPTGPSPGVPGWSVSPYRPWNGVLSPASNWPHTHHALARHRSASGRLVGHSEVDPIQRSR